MYNTYAATANINTNKKLAIVAAQFNHFIVDSLVSGAQSVLKKYGFNESNVDIIEVPGAFELPFVVKKLALCGRYEGIVALGAVIRGATPHFDYVAGTCANGLAQIALDTGVAITNGVLTTDTIEQAIERAGTKSGNKGSDAANALVEVLSIIQSLEI